MIIILFCIWWAAKERDEGFPTEDECFYLGEISTARDFDRFMVKGVLQVWKDEVEAVKEGSLQLFEIR